MSLTTEHGSVFTLWKRGITEGAEYDEWKEIAESGLEWGWNYRSD